MNPPPPIDPQGQKSNTGYSSHINQNTPYPLPTPPGSYPNSHLYDSNPAPPSSPPYGQLDPASNQILNPYATGPSTSYGYQSGAGIPPAPPVTAQRNKASKWLIFFIVSAILLLIISSFIVGNVVNNTIATNNANATATAQVITNHLATATAQAQATAAALANPYQPSGTLAWIDPLTQASKWQNGSDVSWGGRCQFVNNAYQIYQSPPKKFFRCEEPSTYSNFAFEVKMRIDQGDCGGLIVRHNDNGHYLLEVCQNGNYDFFNYPSHRDSITLTRGNAPAIHQGIDQLNVIAVVANGSSFDLYVNGQKIETVSDSTYSQGALGLVAVAYDNMTAVTYQNARLWTI
ncbi:MAG: LamG domain-containing protein [Chloroflexi bacterium]|nr:MAG: LamG domain-containing protein [Chloroflexota bacterium]